MTLQEKLPDLQITLSNLIRSIESEYRELSKATVSESPENRLKKKLLDSVSTGLDSLTEAYFLCSDAIQLEAEGIDLSELLESLNDEPGADNEQ